MTTRPTIDPAQAQAAARALTAAQLILATPADEVTGAVELVMGEYGRVPAASGFIYPVALTVPAEAERLDDAVQATGLAPLWARLGRGWTEQDADSATTTYLLGVAAEDNAAFARATAGLAATRAEAVDGTAIANLHIMSEAVPVAPTAGRTLVAGDRGSLTQVTPSELMGIGAVLDLISDVSTARVPQAFDPRQHDGRTVLVRDAYNRVTSLPEMEALLAKAGWAPGEATTGATRYVRGVEHGALHHDSRVYYLLDDRQPMMAFRAFDLRVAAAPRGVKSNPDDVARWLVDRQQVAVEAPLVEAAGARPRISRELDTLEATRRFVEAIRTARLRFDRELPLAFVDRSTDGDAQVITLTPGETTMRWSSAANSQLLLLAAAQFAKKDREGQNGQLIPGEPEHSIPGPLVQGVLEALKGPGALPPLEIVASEPIVTSNGVVSRPGYDPEARAMLRIPHHQRASWAHEYVVPAEPTQEDAQKAYEYLRDELLSDFAFVSATDEARAFSYVLTAAARNLSNGSIGFAFNAPDAATGKSLLADVGRLLGKGSLSNVSFQIGVRNNEEAKKELGALLNSGGRFFHDDDVQRDTKVSGRVVNSAITELDGSAGHRLLGANNLAVLRGVIVTICGNEMVYGRDLNRRFLRMNLQKPPGQIGLNHKKYRHSDLLAFVRANRPKLLAAVHTIMWHSQLRKSEEKRIPSMNFSHNWHQTFLGAMSWLTGPDGRTLDELALEGWAGEVAATEELGDEWGDLARFVWTTVGSKWMEASKLRELVKAAESAAGVEVPMLPTRLLNISAGTSEMAANRAWGMAFKSLGESQIPYEGVVYRWVPYAKSSNSNKSQRYKLEVYVDGRLLRPDEALPGDDPQPASEVAAEPEVQF